MKAVGLLVQDLSDRADRLLALIVCDLEHRPLGLLDELTRRRDPVEHVGLDLPGRQPSSARICACSRTIRP